MTDFSHISVTIYNTKSWYLAWFKHSLGFRDFSGSFERDLLPRISVEHAEEVVVGASHDGRVVAIPTALKLVENTIVFIQRAQFRPQILVNCVSLNGFRLHVKVPHLDR